MATTGVEDEMTSDVGESQDSPVRRQFSEPMHSQSESSSTADTPSPLVRRSKCAWCGKLFQSFFGGDDVSHAEALKIHIAKMHPHLNTTEAYDGAADDDLADDEDAGENEAEYADDEAAGETADVRLDEGLEEPANEQLEEAGNGEIDEVFDEDVDANRAEDAAVERGDDGAGESGNVTSKESTTTDLADEAEKAREISRTRYIASIKRRLSKSWTMHDVNEFCPDYDDMESDAEESWKYTFCAMKRGKKRDAAEVLERPEPYKKRKGARGEFLEMTPIGEFLVQLRDPEKRPHEELYAITLNTAHALKAWQDESLSIDRLIREATRRSMQPLPNPRKTEDSRVFEDKKAAMLYGFRHDPKADKISNQDAFIQGGFKPTPAQFRRTAAKAGPNNPNPDGWTPAVKFGVEHVPKFQEPPREDFVAKSTRNKRKVAQAEAASKANETDEGTIETGAALDTEKESSAPPPRKRIRTRGAMQVVSAVEITQTASPSPAPARTSGRGRGRGRGRGGYTTPRGASETPQPTTPGVPTTAPPARGRGRPPTVPKQPTAPMVLQPAPTPSVHLRPAQVAPGAANTALAPTHTAAGPVETVTTPVSDGGVDLDELARREKIANSKNPKRTEAMLRHWQRFNKEGRTRNPKRTKAQILADQAREAAERAAQPVVKPPPPVRKSNANDDESTTADATAHAPTSLINHGAVGVMGNGPHPGASAAMSFVDGPAPMGPLQPSVFPPPALYAPYPYPPPGPPMGPGQMMPQPQGYHHSPYADHRIHYPVAPMPQASRPHGAP